MISRCFFDWFCIRTDRIRKRRFCGKSCCRKQRLFFPRKYRLHFALWIIWRWCIVARLRLSCRILHQSFSNRSCALAVFLLSFFIGMCRRAVSGIHCRSPPSPSGFLHFQKFRLEENTVKYAPRKVYIKESGNYVELSYTDFCRRRQADQSYMDNSYIAGKLLVINGSPLEIKKV